MRTVCLGLLLLCSTPLWGLNIVLTNDDGFETANIQFLYRALREAGHDVVMSAPYSGQSGTGGQITIMRPIGPTAEASPDGVLPAGSPGVGETGMGAQQYYVDGSPAMALLYGIDVLAQRTWGQAPDLVISGPNEGNNLGIVTPHSGTLGATVTALNKGLPAIAVSAANGDPDQAVLVSNLVVKLLGVLTVNDGLTLPGGVGLNVNTPEIDVSTTKLSDMQFRFTQIGGATRYGLQFFEKLGESEFATREGVPAELALPGLSVGVPPSSAGYPEDSAADSESRVLSERTVTISPIQGTYAADSKVAEAVRALLGSAVDG